jgi:hypothetical protein
MRLRRIRQTLWTATGASSALAIVAIVWGAIRPTIPHLPGQQSSDARFVQMTSTEPLVTVQDLERVAQVDLRRPLHDPPPPTPPPPPPVTSDPPLDIQLTGTIYEPGHCRAMIQLPDGTIQLRAVGDIVGSATILQIEKRQVTIEYFGKLIVLDVANQIDN